jgi:hypothetical protein
MRSHRITASHTNHARCVVSNWLKPSVTYLRHNNVNTPGATIQVCTSSICSGSTHAWFGMYSHVTAPALANTLSVADRNVPNIVNFLISDSPPDQLTFSLAPTPLTALTGVTISAGCGIAPTTGTGSTSRIYLAVCGHNTVDVVSNVMTGGAVSVFANLYNSYGVATEPTGQY